MRRPQSRTELRLRLLGTAFLVLFAIAELAGLPSGWAIVGIVLWLACFLGAVVARRRTGRRA